jgi:hypothetical protein
MAAQLLFRQLLHIYIIFGFFVLGDQLEQIHIMTENGGKNDVRHERDTANGQLSRDRLIQELSQLCAHL